MTKACTSVSMVVDSGMQRGVAHGATAPGIQPEGHPTTPFCKKNKLTIND